RIRKSAYGSRDKQRQLLLNKMVMGEFNRVSLAPSSATVRSGDACLYDNKIDISETENKITKITHEEEVLEAETDYVLNEASTRLTLKKDFVKSLQEETDTKTKVI